MVIVSATLAVSLVIISIMIGSNIMTSSPAEQQQLSFTQQSGNKSLQSDNEVKEKNNKAIVIAFTEAFNTRNASALDNIVAQNVIEHRPGIQSGLNTYKQFLNSMITAFPDFHTTVDHILAEGD
jgi:hypothetical protein